MVQESYADFSIIQKYLDQKKHHEEEIKSFEEKITEFEKSIAILKEELNSRDQVITQLQNQLGEIQMTVKKREKSIQDLNIQIHRMKQQGINYQEQQQQQGTSVFEDTASRKAKFGFLK